MDPPITLFQLAGAGTARAGAPPPGLSPEANARKQFRRGGPHPGVQALPSSNAPLDPYTPDPGDALV